MIFCQSLVTTSRLLPTRPCSSTIEASLACCLLATEAREETIIAPISFITALHRICRRMGTISWAR